MLSYSERYRRVGNNAGHNIANNIVPSQSYNCLICFYVPSRESREKILKLGLHLLLGHIYRFNVRTVNDHF